MGIGSFFTYVKFHVLKTSTFGKYAMMRGKMPVPLHQLGHNQNKRVHR